MIGEEIRDILKEVNIEDLRKVTWDYSEVDIIGLYNGEIVRGFMWTAKKCCEINPLAITKCNVKEGWVEHLEYEVLPDTQNCLQFFKSAKIKRDEKTDEPIRTKLNCKVVIDLLDAKGNVIVTVS